MQIKYAIFSCLSALCLCAFQSEAKTVDILGITTDGHNGQIKARLDLEGKTLAGVTTYSYNMTDGFTTIQTAYSIYDDNGDTYMSAPVAYYPDEDGYTYRIQLKFADNTQYLSEVVNQDLTEAFMWLGDYDYAAGKSGWDDAHPPVVDKEIDSSLQLTLDGRIYYKAVCNHAPGYLLYKFDNTPFTRFMTRCGVQDTQSYGDIQFVFSKGADETSLQTVEKFTMYSKTNPDRNGADCVKDIDIDMAGVGALRIDMNQYDYDNWGDHGHLALARLYLPAPAATAKKSQTVTFSTPGGTLGAETALSASSSSGGKVFYNIISGNDYATLEGNMLKPTWGAKGIVVVEAIQFGNDSYYPATSYQSFTVDTSPRMELLGMYRPSITGNDSNCYAYLLVDTKGKTLDRLMMTTYDNPKTLTKKDERSLLDMYSAAKGAQVIEIPLPGYTEEVLRISYGYSGDNATVTLPYWHETGSYDYVSDFPTSSYSVVVGWGSFQGPNAPYNNMNGGVLEIGNGTTSIQKYAKGFGIHATGYVNVAATQLSPYYRIITDMGAQKDGTSNRANQKLTFQLQSGNTVLADTVDVFKPGIQYWDFPINNQQPLRLIGNCGSDGNGNDYVCIGAPRLYYTLPTKTPQQISWDQQRRIISNNDLTINLDASSESGFPIFYHIVAGGEYASIRDGKLIIHSFPKGGAEIVVDAFQPGNDAWGTTNVASCSFGLVRGLEVGKDEYVEIKNSDTLDELIIHADKSSAGQVSVASGIVDVRKLVLKYTFVPGELVHIAFPADLDIDKISDLKTLGYSFNAYGAPAYFIKEYDTDERFAQPDGDPWKMLEYPSVKANRGYLMGLDSSLGDEPVEVTFNIDNSAVDLGYLMKTMGLTIDLSGMQPNSKQTITVSSANPDIVSNNLTIDVTFNPADITKLPINYGQALENMRYVFVGDNKAMRLTLPDQTPAKVVFFGKDGKTVVKAVRYVAPNVIDLTDMKSGKYNMVVSYGNAIKTYPVEL